MPAVAWFGAADRWSVDRCLMQSLLVLSSSDAARGAAAAWLAAFDAARVAGASEMAAHAEASRAGPAAPGAQGANEQSISASRAPPALSSAHGRECESAARLSE
jgi:hypothetical protein